MGSVEPMNLLTESAELTQDLVGGNCRTNLTLLPRPITVNNSGNAELRPASAARK